VTTSRSTGVIADGCCSGAHCVGCSDHFRQMSQVRLWPR